MWKNYAKSGGKIGSSCSCTAVVIIATAFSTFQVKVTNSGHFYINTLIAAKFITSFCKKKNKTLPYF